MSILGDLGVLPQIQKVVLCNCFRIFVADALQRLLISFNYAFFNTFVKIYLNEVSEKSDSEKILFISAFIQASFELFQIIKATFVLLTVIKCQSVVIKKFFPFRLRNDLFILADKMSTEHSVQSSCKKIDKIFLFLLIGKTNLFYQSQHELSRFLIVKSAEMSLCKK